MTSAGYRKAGRDERRRFLHRFAVLGAVLLMPGAKESQSPLLYVCILRGLFVGVPAILGIAVVHENLRKKSRGHAARR